MEKEKEEAAKKAEALRLEKEKELAAKKAEALRLEKEKELAAKKAEALRLENKEKELAVQPKRLKLCVGERKRKKQPRKLKHFVRNWRRMQQPHTLLPCAWKGRKKKQPRKLKLWVWKGRTQSLRLERDAAVKNDAAPRGKQLEAEARADKATETKKMFLKKHEAEKGAREEYELESKVRVALNVPRKEATRLVQAQQQFREEPSPEIIEADKASLSW